MNITQNLCALNQFTTNMGVNKDMEVISIVLFLCTYMKILINIIVDILTPIMVENWFTGEKSRNDQIQIILSFHLV